MSNELDPELRSDLDSFTMVVTLYRLLLKAGVVDAASVQTEMDSVIAILGAEFTNIATEWTINGELDQERFRNTILAAIFLQI